MHDSGEKNNRYDYMHNHGTPITMHNEQHNSQHQINSPRGGINSLHSWEPECHAVKAISPTDVTSGGDFVIDSHMSLTCWLPRTKRECWMFRRVTTIWKD